MRDRQAWAVFTNQSDLPYLRFFKKGYRHCFVIINDGKNWISIDPMANYMDVAIHHLPPEFDMVKWLSSRGNIVVPANLNIDINKPAPWMIFTCVEACKRILGIHKRFIITPWQLHNYLQKSTP